jgi:[ribosomal protein S5]-alanine N-acetyltransferase
MLEFIPILATFEENTKILDNEMCKDVVIATLDFYKVVGFNQPWIGYVVKLNGQVVGNGGYKGKPVDNKIEIAYGTVPAFQNKGIGTQICRQLVDIASATDPFLEITAKTLPDNLYSIAILKKNDFKLLGTVYDKDDGLVKEWKYIQHGT